MLLGDLQQILATILQGTQFEVCGTFWCLAQQSLPLLVPLAAHHRLLLVLWLLHFVQQLPTMSQVRTQSSTCHLIGALQTPLCSVCLLMQSKLRLHQHKSAAIDAFGSTHTGVCALLKVQLNDELICLVQSQLKLLLCFCRHLHKKHMSRAAKGRNREKQASHLLGLLGKHQPGVSSCLVFAIELCLSHDDLFQLGRKQHDFSSN